MGGAAWAADLPVKAPPLPAAAPFSWSGCYVGANAGGSRVSIDDMFDSLTAPGSNFFVVKTSFWLSFR